MSLSVASWNICNSFGNPDCALLTAEHVVEADADIVLLQEAFTEENATSTLETARTLLRNGDYTKFCSLPYKDADGRLDRHGMLVAARRPAVMRMVRLATRYAVVITAQDEESGHDVKILGAHLDDRSEASRRVQARATVAELAFSERGAIVGDLNAMHGDDVPARLLRAAAPIVNRLPATDPYPNQEMSFRRLISIAQRLAAMADGGTLDLLSAHAYHEVDVCHQPTWRGIAQLDHILVNDWLHAEDFTRHDATELSDHRMISARLVVDA